MKRTLATLLTLALLSTLMVGGFAGAAAAQEVEQEAEDVEFDAEIDQEATATTTQIQEDIEQENEVELEDVEVEAESEGDYSPTAATLDVTTQNVNNQEATTAATNFAEVDQELEQESAITP
ncbi:hypothetical protein [Natronorubrum sp. FCH18a]|uniref:hypothetical protein n=1 Tax=Natronorubrum sp. FCH18a TaxID=3447018 RepID=UPI003F517D2D